MSHHAVAPPSLELYHVFNIIGLYEHAALEDAHRNIAKALDQIEAATCTEWRDHVNAALRLALPELIEVYGHHSKEVDAVDQMLFLLEKKP